MFAKYLTQMIIKIKTNRDLCFLSNEITGHSSLNISQQRIKNISISPKISTTLQMILFENFDSLKQIKIINNSLK